MYLIVLKQEISQSRFLRQMQAYFKSCAISANILLTKADHMDGQAQIKRESITLCWPWGQNKPQGQD